MRAPCKYAHNVTYLRWVDGDFVKVNIDECWGEKEPSICDARRKEYCDRYKPLYETKLKWKHQRNTDGSWYGVCARCGKEIIGTSNYCPHCGYEYEPWDGTTFK